MIGKEDIDNVKGIIDKAGRLAQSEFDKKRFEKLSREFTVVGDRYLDEGPYNARLH
jgi:uncharacterized protein YozE (UPF0346 family)